MKRLVLLRHAKSFWEWDLDDINRPLTPKGVRRIVQMSELPNHPFHTVEQVFSSPANRALHTAVLMMRHAGIPLSKLTVVSDLYTFHASAVLDFIYSLPESLSQLILVGHNPAFTEVATELSGTAVGHLSTAAWAEIEFSNAFWSQIQKGNIRMGNPKQLL